MSQSGENPVPSGDPATERSYAAIAAPKSESARLSLEDKIPITTSGGYSLPRPAI
jgi:hypothetical protein